MLCGGWRQGHARLWARKGWARWGSMGSMGGWLGLTWRIDGVLMNCAASASSSPPQPPPPPPPPPRAPQGTPARRPPRRRFRPAPVPWYRQRGRGWGRGGSRNAASVGRQGDGAGTWGDDAGDVGGRTCSGRRAGAPPHPRACWARARPPSPANKAHPLRGAWEEVDRSAPKPARQPPRRRISGKLREMWRLLRAGVDLIRGVAPDVCDCPPPSRRSARRR